MERKGHFQVRHFYPAFSATLRWASSWHMRSSFARTVSVNGPRRAHPLECGALTRCQWVRPLPALRRSWRGGVRR
jgi:hypothetical protein